MRLPSLRSVAIGLVFVIGGGTLEKLYAISVDARTPAVLIESLQEGDGVAVRGGSIELDATVKRQKDCRVVVDRWLYHKDGNRTDWWPIESPAAPPIGRGDGIHYRVHLPLPPDLPPSKYFYRARYQDECSFLPGWLSSPPRDTGDVPITVLDANTGSPPVVKIPPGPTLLLPEKP